MTRKNYIEFAGIIANAKSAYSGVGVTNARSLRAIEEIQYNIALYFARDNSRFDKTRFSNACIG